MSKSLSRTLYLIGLGVSIVATILIIAGLAGSTTATDPNTGYTTVTSVGNPTLVGIAVFLFVVGGILGLIAWIGALVKTAMLGRWGWFVCLLLLSGITMLIYIFAGPETRADVQLAYAPQGYPQPGYPQPGYPPQSYPPQGYSQPGDPSAGYSPSGYPPQPGNPQSGGGYPPPPDYPRQ